MGVNMKFRYLALAAAMAFSAPAFAAPSSDTNTVPPYGSQIGGIGGEAFISPETGLVATRTYNLGAGWYTFGIAAKAIGSSLGSFAAILTDSTGNTIFQKLSLLTTNASPVLFDAVNNFHLDAGIYKITITGGWATAVPESSGAAAAIYNGVAPVPGPEAGAGLGALALGGMALYMKRRRKKEATAA